MASRKEYEMLFQLDAKLGSSYTSTFSKAKSGPSELQKEIRSLQSVQADISAYTKQQAAVEKTQAKLDNLNKQYQLLQQEIKETSGPTTSLERESAKLEQRIGDTSNALAAQKEKLGATAKSLNEAGVGTDNLGSKSQDLADKLNTLRAKEEAAAESAEEYGDKGTSSIEAVSQAFAAAKVYEGLEQIKDAYMDCINSAGDFEASMSNVEALSGASGDQLQALTDKAKEMGATTKFTAGESADALSYMALAGWDTQSMLQGISPVMELAAAANMDLASASDIVTDYLTAFGLTASDTTHFVDVMAYAMSHSNTNVEQLGEAYKACAATAKSMGYSVEETTAVLATMANAGVKGGEAGTALNAIMTRLATNTKGCADELEKYGVSIYDSQGNMNSLSDILTGLSAVWDNLTDQEQANLAKTIAGTNQYSKLQTIMAGCSDQAAKGGQSFSDYASALENCSGTAGKMAGTMLDNLNGKMTLFESAADGLEIAVGEQLTPAMSDLYEVGADVLSGMTEFVNDNPGVVKGITTTVAVLGTAAAGIAGVTAAVNLASAAAAAFTAVTSVALGPVALAVAGVAAVTGAFVAVTSAADAAVEASGDWPPALDEITTAANGVTNALDDANATMQASAETTMATAGTADLYITKLEEMGDYAKLSADDQQEYRNVLTLLCDLIPDLAGYIDTTTGKIQGGTTALRGYAKAWQDSAKAQAYQEFMSDVSQQYNDVTKELYQNQLKLTEAQTKGEAASKGMDETYQKLLSTLGMTDDEFQKTYGSVSAIAGVHLDPEIADEVMDLRDSYEEYSNQQLEAAENEKVYQQAVDDGIAKQGEAQQAIEDAQTAYENLEAAQSGATSSASEGAAELGQAISDVTVEAQKLVEAYNTAYDAAEKSIGGQYEIWDKASSVSATSVDALNKNLESQTTYWQDYNTNLDTLREKAGSIEGLSDMVASFADGSKESVDAIAGMAQAAQDGGGKLETMVKNWQDAQLGMGESTALFPAFIINGQEVDEIYISKYLNIVQNGRAYSLPGVDPAASMNFDQARSYCEAKGDGWHCMTRMEWGLLMRICEMQGFIPLGNNNYGKHSSEQFYKAIKTYDDSGKTGRTATGTGPLTWYHDNSPSGIADLVGDVWEWAGGVRTVYGELQVMANNNGADAANSQGTSSTKWMAISADDGSYITPDGSGTTANSVKLDIVSGHIQWSKTITTRNKDSDWPSCSFAAITCDSTISDAAKLVLQCLGMLPYKATDLCAKAGHQCWFRNLDAERAFSSGGTWHDSSYGLASFDGHGPRSYTRARLGFRAAFVKLPTA